MLITINDNPVTVADNSTVAEVIKTQNIAPTGYAVAVNNKVIPITKLATVTLQPNDSVLIIQAYYGG